MENDKTILTDEQLNDVVKELEDNVPEQIVRQRELVESGATLDPETENIIDEKYVNVSPDGTIMVEDAMFEPAIAESGLGIDEAINGGLEEENIEKISDAITTTATGALGLSDDEAARLLDVIIRYRKGDKFPLYQELPEQVKASVRDLAQQVDAPASEWNRISRIVIDEFIEESKMDEAFIDLEKSMKETLQIPDFMDLYSEHIKEMMTTKTHEIADTVQEENPEKAELLRKISDAFVSSYKLEGMINHYDNNTRTRKAMRRDWPKVIKFCEEVNFRNEDTKFKMSDCRAMIPALEKVFGDEGTLEYTKEDIYKFVILWCKMVDLMDPNDVIQATYIYYGMKSIIMLQFTNEAKTDFAIELIGNIKDVINQIRAREEEFNASRKQ